MVRTSKRKLSSEQLGKVNRILYRILGEGKDEKEFLELFDDVFTETERQVFAKRVVVAYLLTKGVPQHEVSDILHASVSTVSRYAAILERDSRLKKAIRRVLQRESVKHLIEDMVDALTPLYPGIYIGHAAIARERKRKKAARKTLG